MRPNKIFKVSTVALVLVLTMAATLITLLPSVDAQVIQYRPEFMFVAAAPDPIGVGQQIAIVCWTSEMAMPCDDDPLLGAPGGRECWTGETLTITKPDGTKQTINLPPSDPVGSNYYIYTPDTAGTYSVQAHVPGQWKNRTAPIPYGLSYWTSFEAGSYYFEPADSEIVEFVVQEEQVPWWPGAALPTEYWTRPIDAGLREWTTIAGNWLADGRGNPYTTGPETAHIMWTEPQFFGGIAGEPFGHISISEGTSYEAKWTGVVSMLGRLYYNVPLSDSTTSSYRKVVCRDLRTGELLWEVNGTSLSTAMIYEYWSRNQHGVHPYLWTYDNRILDPFSGTELFRYTNVPRGTAAVGPTGERLIYILGGPPEGRTWLALWNSTAPISMRGGPIGTSFDQWRPVGKVIDGSTGYEWNVTLPSGLSDMQTYRRMGGAPVGQGIVYVLDDRIISGSGYMPFGISSPHENFTAWAVSTEEDRLGEELWNIQVKVPAPNVTMQWSSVSQEEGVFVLRAKETRQFIGYSLDTGKELWTTDPQNNWMMYSSGSTIADGKLLSGGYGGTLYAYDIETGNLLWTAYTDLCELEGPYDRWPISIINVIDGKVYINTGEHSHTHPLYRGWSMYCFDLETGAPIWNMTGIWQSFAFADGYIVSLNLMDIQVYCFGKGPTATTVTASPKSSVQGTSVVIEGMVTDESPGTKEYALTARFPNGVPAIADEHMTAWMDYVYKQHAMPTDAKGVEVTLDTVDPNGNWIHIGRVTSDISGSFSYMWTPDIEGKYTVIATFEGSESYYASYAETAIGVGPAPEEPTEPAVQEDVDQAVDSLRDSFTPMFLGIIVAVVVTICLVIYTLWTVRKLRK